MSWPQWPGAAGMPQPGIVQAPLINPAPNVINPATAIVPTGQYTPEQWAQMQQQNWQQWAQWQQQFQQWQQQYGAEYQKSITAMAAQARPTPVQPPVPFFNMSANAAPPLPAETKPPPPPDDCQIGQAVNAAQYPSFTSAPPPVPQPNFNAGPSAQPPPPKEPFLNQYNPNQSIAPSNQGGFSNRNLNEGYKGDNQQRFGGNQNYSSNNNKGPNQNPNWQNQNNRNQQGYGDSRFNQPPANETRSRGEFGAKRPFNQPKDAGDSKRNKVEASSEGNSWQGNQRKPRWEAPSPLPENQRWNSKPADNIPKHNPEELTEAEKKFDKQFAEWEAQFQKWKEQNANHPDKEQYREYEKKWEAWRSQLLDRREQMRRKRLGLASESPQPASDKSSQSKPDNVQQKLPDRSQISPHQAQIGPQSYPLPAVGKPGLLGVSPQATSSVQSSLAGTGKSGLLGVGPQTLNAKTISSNADKPDQYGNKDLLTTTSNLSTTGMSSSRPPPNLNDQPLDFKKPRLEFGEEFEPHKKQLETELGDQDAGDGFLKSSSTGGIPGLDLVKDGKDESQADEHLAEQKTCKESENQKRPDLEAISRGINSILGDQKIMNILSMVSQNQNRPVTSSTVNTVSPIKLDSPKFSPEPPQDDYSNNDNGDFYETQNDMFSNTDEQTRSSFNVLNDADVSEFDSFGKPDEYSANLDFNRGPGNFNRGPSWNRGPDNFNKDPGVFNRDPDNSNRGPNNFNRDLDNFNRGSDNFSRGRDNFSRGPDNYNRGPNNFNTDSDNFNRGPDNFNRGPDNFNRGPDNFNRDPDNFSRGAGNFNRGPDNFNRVPDNFNRGPDNFSKGPDHFNRGPDNFTSVSDNFNKGPDSFSRGPDDFRGSSSFKKGADNFSRGPESFNRSSDKFNRGLDNFNRGPNFNRDPDNFDRGPDGFNRGSDDFNRVPDNLNRGPDRFNRGSNNFARNSDSFSRGPDNFNRGPSDFNRDTENFNRDGRGSNNFSSGPDNFSRGGPDDGSKQFDIRAGSTGGFEDESDRFSKKSDSFNRGSRIPGNFDEETNNFGKEQESFSRESQNFDKSGFNRGPDNFNNVEAGLFQPAAHAEWNRSNSFPNDLVPSQPQELVSDEKVQLPQEEAIWKPNSVIDYDHKPIKPAEPDVIVEPVYTFDYRHKPLNRIPYPQRPKWLSNMVKNYPEFDLAVTRPFEQQLRRYPVNERFDSRLAADGYQKYDDRSRKFYDDRDRKPFNDRDRIPFDDRDRIPFDDRDRKPFMDHGRKPYDDWDRKPYDDRDRKPFDDWDRKPYDHSTRKPDDKRSRDFGDRRTFDGQNTFTDKKPVNRDSGSFKPRGCSQEKDEPSAKDKTQNKEQNRGEENFNPKAAPTVTNKSNVTLIEDLLCPPGRYSRPPRLVIILRGPPGSGKSFLAKLIKDKEVENGGSAPRILCLDDYFMVEQEKEVEEDGRKVKAKEMVYEFEECMEASYRTSLMKSFKKTITDGYFNFIIVDNINDKVKYFGEMWSFAKQNGFQVYICQMELDVQTCTKRNVHGRSEVEIERCVAAWEPTPSHHPVLDATALIQSGSISEVEMEEINSPASENMNEEEHLITSKWDTFDYSVDNLAKLDGTNKPLRPSRTMEDYLQLDDNWVQPVCTRPGQKRVRWADLEERKEQEKMRAIGFVVGQTNWDRMMDPSMGSAALTQTKYIERYN